MPLFGPPNVKKLAAKHDLKGLIKALGYQKDSGVRRAAAFDLGKLGDARAVEPLIGALRDVSSGVRDGAVLALEAIGDARVVEPLIDALGDHDATVQKRAAKALVSLRWQPTSAAQGMVWYLADALNREPWDAVLRLAASDVSEFAAIIAGPSIHASFAAVKALGEIQGTAATDALVESGLRHPDKYLREAAIDALGAIGDDRAVRPLIGMLDDSDGRVWCAAIGALGAIGDPIAATPVAKMFWKLSSGNLPQGVLGTLSVIVCSLLKMGDAGIDALSEAAADTDLFWDILEVGQGASVDLEPLRSSLRSQFAIRRSTQRDRLTNLYDRATWKVETPYFGDEARTVGTLMFLGDFTQLTKLLELRADYMRLIRNQDTSEGGTTYSQVYGSFCHAVDDIEREARSEA